MSPILLLVGFVGQLASPQSRGVETAPGPSQTLMLLQYAPPPIPGRTSILVSDLTAVGRLKEGIGYAFIESAQKHRRQRLMQVVTQAPAATMQTVTLVPTPVATPAPVMALAVPIPVAAAPVSLPAKTVPAAVPVVAKPVTYAVPSAQSEAAPPPPSPSCVAPAPTPPPLTPTAPILLVPDPSRQQQIHQYFTVP
jgi:hypothetical protein